MKESCVKSNNRNMLKQAFVKVCMTALLFVFAVTTTLASESYSQSTKLTVVLSNTSIEDVLRAIENQSEFRFFYSEAVNVDKKVDVDMQGKRVFDVLDEVLRETEIKYEVIGRQVALYNDDSRAEAMNMMQAKSVKGKVVGAEGESLPGVTVLVKGTTVGTVTDVDGAFSINVPAGGDVLIFSFIGMETQSVVIGNQTSINVTMQSSSIGLDEVVAVGYGVQKRSDVTGAMVSVSAEKLTAMPVSNAFEALQGKAAGVDITSNERPGEIGSILIRGVRSLSASNSPLYVVDGVPLMSASAIETLNPRDIESVDVLKDASATAIYGSRGANGVIIVTTKKGKDGRMELNYSGTFTVENIVDKSPAMSASDYLTWRRWAYYNSEEDVYAPGNAPTKANDEIIFGGAGMDQASYNNIMKGWSGSSWDGSKVVDTDWTDFVTQTALTQEHTLSASGGNSLMNSYVSFGYLDNKGTQKGQEYSRYTGKVSVDITPKDWFKMGGTINATWSNQEYGFSRTGQSSNSGPTSIYEAAKSIGRFALPYDENGDIINTPGNMGGNGSVYTVIDEWEKSNDQRQIARVLASFYAKVDFGEISKLLDGLTYSMNFGPDFRNYRKGIYIDNSSAVRLGSAGSYASLSNRRDFSWTLDEQIDYNKKFGLHKVSATLLHSASAWNIEESGMSGNNIPKSSYMWNNMDCLDITATESAAGMSSGLTERSLESYMARANYSFNEKYLLTLTGRWDGASQLSTDHKWDFFPSASLAWRLDQENFLEGVSAINQMKLRFGVGTTGNSAVSPYQTLGALAGPYYVPFGTGGGNTVAYTTNEPFYTNSYQKMSNPELGWEKTTQYNIGVDFGLVDNRIYGTVDFYKSTTNDLLMDVTIPSLTGYISTYANVGKTKNHGVDITLNVVPVKTKNFVWDLGFNAAYQKDEIVELAYGKNDMVDNSWFIGESLNVFYGYDNDGLWQESDKDEMAKYTGNSFEAGMVKPVDQTGDYVIDGDDRVILGNKNPKFTLGINSTFNIFKDFELSFMMYGRMGYMVSTGGEGQLGLFQQREIDYWTPDNTGAEWQKPILSTAGGDSYSSLLGFREASFLKMRNISLGYNVPSNVCSKIGINNVKVYVQAKNPFTVYSSIDWLDLDLGGSTFNRSWVFGLNIGF